eukprot:gene24709-10347_t
MDTTIALRAKGCLGNIVFVRFNPNGYTVNSVKGVCKIAEHRRDEFKKTSIRCSTHLTTSTLGDARSVSLIKTVREIRTGGTAPVNMLELTLTRIGHRSAKQQWSYAIVRARPPLSASSKRAARPSSPGGGYPTPNHRHSAPGAVLTCHTARPSSPGQFSLTGGGDVAYYTIPEETEGGGAWDKFEDGMEGMGETNGNGSRMTSAASTIKWAHQTSAHSPYLTPSPTSAKKTPKKDSKWGPSSTTFGDSTPTRGWSSSQIKRPSVTQSAGRQRRISLEATTAAAHSQLAASVAYPWRPPLQRTAAAEMRAYTTSTYNGRPSSTGASTFPPPRLKKNPAGMVWTPGGVPVFAGKVPKGLDVAQTNGSRPSSSMPRGTLHGTHPPPSAAPPSPRPLHGHLSKITSSIAEQPVYNTEEGAIHTSQDVLDYFTRHGHGAVKKLFHLVNAKPKTKYDIMSPFSLVVVPLEKVGDEYYTMSIKGVVHMCKIEENEGVFRKLRFFKNFFLTKSFGIWRADVRRILYERVHRTMKGSMLSAQLVFQPALLKIQAVIVTISEMNMCLISGRFDKLFALEEFVEDQDRHREKTVIPGLGSHVHSIVEILLEVSNKAEQEKLKMENMTDIQELMAAGFEVGMPSMTGKNKSISVLKAERQELVDAYKECMRRVSQLPLLMHQVDFMYCEAVVVSQLPLLMRQVDYMYCEAVVDIVVKAMSSIHTYFEDPTKSRGVFHTNISFESESFSFSPTREQVLEGTRYVMSSILSVISDLPRPLASKAISQRYLNDEDSLLDVLEVIQAISQRYLNDEDSLLDVLEDTPRFNELKKSILQNVETSFDRAEEYVSSTFESHRAIYERKLSWNLSTYESEGCSAALEQSKEWCHSLEQRPRDLGGYAKTKLLYQDMERDKDALYAQVQLVDDMFDLFKDHGGKLDIKDQLQLEALHDTSSGGWWVKDHGGKLDIKDQLQLEALHDTSAGGVDHGGKLDIKDQLQLEALHDTSSGGWWVKVGKVLGEGDRGRVEVQPVDDMFDLFKDHEGKLDIEDQLQLEALQRYVFWLVLVDDMFDLFKDHGGKLDIKDQLQLEALHDTSSELRQKIVDVGDWVEERHSEMAVELAKNSEELGEDSLNMLNEMSTSALNLADSEPASMLELVHNLEERLADMEQAARNFRDYQSLLEEPGDDFGSLQHVWREFERRKDGCTKLNDNSTNNNNTNINANSLLEEPGDDFGSLQHVRREFEQRTIG